MKKIQAVIFDIDDTLYCFSKADPIAREAIFGYCENQKLMTKEEAIELHAKIYREQAICLGKYAASHNRLIRYQMMLEEKGLPLFPHAMNMAELYWETVMSVSQPEPGISDLFRRLKRAGVAIGIGTNMTSMIQFKKLEYFGLAPYIDFIVTSEEAGVEKPDPVFFQKCVQKAHCSADECIFIGDSIGHDMNGARAVGMNAVLYRPKWKTVSDETVEFPVIHDYRECLTENAIHLGDCVIENIT